MKYKNKVITPRANEVLVIPRNDGDIIFEAKCVVDYSEMEKLNPKPLPPKAIKRGGQEFLDVKNPGYLNKVDAWAKNRISWMIIESLSATKDLEWETVDLGDCTTWQNFDQELTTAGFSHTEIEMITGTVLTACGLDQDKIDQATKDFLVLREKTQE